MDKTLIFGHKSPDTDSIVASIIMEDLEKKMGNENVQACKLGSINKETKYVLDYFKVTEPSTVDCVSNDDTVILVDHNGFAQSAKGIECANILKVIDHHNISGFETKDPLYYFAEPVGCTTTILYELYQMNQVPIEKQMAGLMLSGIISDTLLFNSPTCTPKDIEIANQLGKLLDINIEEYGLAMLKAGADLSSFSPNQLINIDSKEFNVNNTKIQIAQVNTVSIEDVLKDKEEIKQAINQFIKENKIDLFVFAITDILNNNSQMIALGKRIDAVEKAYHIKLEDDMAYVKGVVSRKKQMVPCISENI